MKDKLKFIVPLVLLLVGGGVYKFVLAKPALAKSKIHGTVYILQREFLINLADGRFAKLGVGLVLDPSVVLPTGAEAPKAPEGFGALEQEAIVRDIVTDTLTNRRDSDLISRGGRRRLKESILKAITARTDVKVNDVLFTDVAIQ